MLEECGRCVIRHGFEVNIQKLTHALRLDQGMEHVRGDQVQVLELYRFHGAPDYMQGTNPCLCQSSEGFLQDGAQLAMQAESVNLKK